MSDIVPVAGEVHPAVALAVLQRFSVGLAEIGLIL
jgi:hypothetical protein